MNKAKKSCVTLCSIIVLAITAEVRTHWQIKNRKVLLAIVKVCVTFLNSPNPLQCLDEAVKKKEKRALIALVYLL